MKLQRIKYENLSAKQQEIYNFQKVAARLADYGYNCIKLDDDWQGADFLAYHRDGSTLKIQLKGRLTIAKKYIGKNLWMAFPCKDEERWYLIKHDALVKKVKKHTKWHKTKSWRPKDGAYSSANPNTDLLSAIERCKI